jgi:hypothetical protein
MTELEAWQFLITMFKLPPESTEYTGFGMCFAIRRLRLNGLIPQLLHDAMLQKIWDSPLDSGSYWFPTNSAGNMKRVEWMSEQVDLLMKG